MAQRLEIGAANPFFDPKKALDVHHAEQQRRETRRQELLRQRGRALKEQQLAGFRAETAGLGRIGPRDQMRGLRSSALAGKEADIAEMSLREIDAEISRLDQEIAQGAAQKPQLILNMRQSEMAKEQEKEAVTKAKQAGERQNMLSRFDTVAALLEDYLGENPGTPKAPEIATVVQDLAALEANPDFQQGAALLKTAHSLIRDVDKEMSPYHPFAKRVTEVGKSIGDARKVIDRYNAEQAVLATTAPAAEAAAPAAQPAARGGFSTLSLEDRERTQQDLRMASVTGDTSAPVFGKIAALRESMNREAAMMRGEPIEGGPGASMAEVLQRVAGRDSGPAAAPAGTNPIHIRGQTPPTPTMRAENIGGVIDPGIARGEAFREGRFFTNVGTGGEIRRVLPPGSAEQPTAAMPGDPQPPVRPANEPINPITDPNPLRNVRASMSDLVAADKKPVRTMQEFLSPPAQEPEVTIRPVEAAAEEPAPTATPAASAEPAVAAPTEDRRVSVARKLMGQGLSRDEVAAKLDEMDGLGAFD
jgi:hypothetical protein